MLIICGSVSVYFYRCLWWQAFSQYTGLETRSFSRIFIFGAKGGPSKQFNYFSASKSKVNNIIC